MMDADERALLAAIIANPDEDTPRLIYADWLQEHDQPDRAEYIRLSIQLANLRYSEPNFEAREEQLLAQRTPLEKEVWETGERELTARIPANRDMYFHYDRGFVVGMYCSTKYFLDNADVLFRETPLRSFCPNTLTPTTAKRLVNSPHFRRLKAIKFTRPERALALLGCPSIEIDMFDCYHYLYFSAEWDEVATAVAGHAGLKSVKWIDFQRCGIGDAAGQALADSPHIDPDVLKLLTNEMTAPVKAALRKRYGPRVWLDPPDQAGFPRRDRL